MRKERFQWRSVCEHFLMAKNKSDEHDEYGGRK